MKRLAVVATVLALALCTAIGGATGIASASASNTTSVTLVCDKNVDATVSLRLQPSQFDTTFLGQVDIACGPNSNIERQRNRFEAATGTLAAGWVVVDSWTNSADPTSDGCAIAGDITFKSTCATSGGIGSQLTVR